MDHAYMPIGPVGKPTELHLMYPILAMTHTKYPQACKALMAFMLEADQFNKWIEAAQGYLTHCLNAYDSNPVWTADPKRTVFRDVAKRTLTAGGQGSVGEKAAAAIADFVLLDMFASYCTGREGRQGGDADRRAAVAAHLSLTAMESRARRHAASGTSNQIEHDRRRPPSNKAPAARGQRMGPAEGQPQLAGAVVHAAGGGVPDPVPRLSARPRRLAVVHRRSHRPQWRVRRAGKLRMALGRFRRSGSRCSTRCSTPSSPASSNSRSDSISALLLNENLPCKAMLRAVVLIPFIVPTVLSAIAFWWLYDSQFSIISWSLRKLGLISTNIDFLGDVWNARWSVIFANIWRGVPFVAITLLAGLQTVSPTLYEAATIDGASRWQIFRHVTYPLLTPIIAVVMTFSVLFTFTDFQLIWVLTRGGPVNATQLMATLSYQRAILGGHLGEGAAISTAMIPFLLGAILISWFGLQRRKWQQGESND
jgi:ABC-type sugar transport system permease subunit